MMMKVASSMLKRGTPARPLSMYGSGQMNFATLVLSEHFEGKLAPSLGSVLTAANEMNDSHIDVLVHGDGCDAQIEEV